MSDNKAKASQLQPVQQQTSPFFKLTPELRIRIYEEVLIFPHRVRLCCKCCRHLHKHALQPPLTRTCREIRAETLRVFYGKNEFVINVDASPGLFERWMQAIGYQNRELFRELWMCKHAWNRWDKFVSAKPTRAGPIATLLEVLGEGLFSGTQELKRLGFTDFHEEDGNENFEKDDDEEGIDDEEAYDEDEYGDFEDEELRYFCKPAAHIFEAEVDFEDYGDVDEYGYAEYDDAGGEEGA